MQVIFTNRQPRILGTCTGRRLLPGRHQHSIGDKELATILACEQFKSWQKLGWVKVKMPQAEGELYVPALEEGGGQEPDAEPAPEDALQEVNLVTAKELIAACGDPELLAAWYDKDTRKGAHEAIMERLEALDVADNPPAEDDASGGDPVDAPSGDDPEDAILE